MKERHARLLQLLKMYEQEGKYVSGDVLSEKLGVSTRTIRSDIRYLNKQYLADAEICSNNRLGYKLVGRMEVFKKQDYLEFNQRAFYIVQSLMEADSWKSYQEIADFLHVSAQTVNSDLNRITELVANQQFEITFETETFSGIRMNGEEIDKRLLLAHFVKRDFATIEELRHELKELFTKWWFDGRQIDDTMARLDESLEQYGISLNMHVKSMLVVAVLIQTYRLNQTAVSKLDVDLCQYGKPLREKLVAQAILKKEGLKNGELLLRESSFLAVQLIGWKVFPDSKGVKDGYLFKNIDLQINESLSILGEKYGYDFLEDHQLVNGLQAHIKRMIYPLAYRILINNPFLSFIKSEYIQAYQMAVVFSKLISSRVSIHIPENEVGYIALHIEAAIERMNDLKIKAAVIFKENHVLATLSKQKIEKNFRQIEVVGMYSINERQQLPENVSLVISQLPIKNIDKKVIVVNEFLQVDDLATIKQNITFGILKDRVSEEKLIYLNESTKEAFLEKMVDYFHLQHYFNGILDRENLSSTDIGNEIAIPHPLFSTNEEESYIYIGVNQQRMTWGERSVRLVFLLILSERDKLRYEYIYREIYQLMKNKSTIENLLTTNSYKAFMENLQ
ncbi:PRD domain-containing protein [Oceanobacillus sp. CFH 90083]|uniref:BglG family transcription antiterminator n=1 Tax=Oceanobacillus sp. CFH 90083 TaxID=2592336 RepID=UPI00128B55AA|nr:PRD domain-containing protein [Oceanobacillus sp. CFH 90083]